MTDDERTRPETTRTDETTRLNSTESRTRTTGSSRRRFLSGVAAATGLALAPSVTATQETTTAAPAAQEAQAEVVADFEPPNLPENIATDDEGNIYVSMAPTHQIWQVPPEDEASSVASIGPEDGEGILLGVTRTDDGTMYAALNSGVSETHGVWRVPADGSPELMASIPTAGTFPNGITHELLDDGVLVTDSTRGAIWRATDEGAEPWYDSPFLDPNPYAASQIGINGIDVGPEGDLYAANLNFGAVLRIPVEDGTPRYSPEVMVQSDDLTGADGIAVDDQRNVYVAVNAQNKVSRVTPDGEIETVVSGGQLDFPSDVHFGPGDDQSTLYVCNFAFLTFQTEGETANPSLMRIDLGEGG